VELGVCAARKEDDLPTEVRDRAALTTIARLEIHQLSELPLARNHIGINPTLVQGRFTLSLNRHAPTAVYVVEIVPADAVTWFAENCESFNRQVPSDALTAVSAQIYWEELKRQVARSCHRAPTVRAPFIHSFIVDEWESTDLNRQVAVSRSSWRVTQPTVSLLVLPRWVVPHPSRRLLRLGWGSTMVRFLASELPPATDSPARTRSTAIRSRPGPPLRTRIAGSLTTATAPASRPVALDRIAMDIADAPRAGLLSVTLLS